MIPTTAMSPNDRFPYVTGQGYMRNLSRRKTILHEASRYGGQNGEGDDSLGAFEGGSLGPTTEQGTDPSRIALPLWSTLGKPTVKIKPALITVLSQRADSYGACEGGSSGPTAEQGTHPLQIALPLWITLGKPTEKIKPALITVLSRRAERSSI
jgi:hypothetical protein